MTLRRSPLSSTHRTDLRRWAARLIAGLALAALAPSPAAAAREVLLTPRGPAIAPPLEAPERQPGFAVARGVGQAPTYSELARLTELIRERPLDGTALIVDRVGGAPAGLHYALARAFEAQDRPADALRHYRRAAASREADAKRAEIAAGLARMEERLAELRARPVACPQDRAALFALEDARGQVHPDRPPLLLVHGYGGAPRELHAIAQRLRDLDRQVFVACYTSRTQTVRDSARQVAAMISAIRRLGTTNRELVVVAHSLGGLVTRVALNQLALDPLQELDGWAAVRFVAIDSPWHGYPGPSDEGIRAEFFAAISPFLPRGLWQMRARSLLFTGDPGSDDPVARAGIFGVELPSHVRVDLVFAEHGADVMSYRDGVLRELPEKLAAWYGQDQAVRGDPRLLNFWRALQSASAYAPFAAAMRELAEAGRLDGAAALAQLERHFPTFPGDHLSILDEQDGGGLIEHLVAALTVSARGSS